MRILQLSILVLITLIATGAGIGASAAYPDKPIQLVVPYPPAGMTDVFARPYGGRGRADRLAATGDGFDLATWQLSVADSPAGGLPNCCGLPFTPEE